MSAHQTTTTRLLRIESVMDKVQLRRTELYSRIKRGTFPKPIKLGARSVAWTEKSIDDWIAALVTGGAQQ